MYDPPRDFSDEHADRGDGDRPRRRAAPSKLRFKLEALIRDFALTGVSLPALSVAAATPDGAEDDDELFRRIDLLTIAAGLHPEREDDLTAEPARSILIAGARRIGVRSWRRPAPTFQDLRKVVAGQLATAPNDDASPEATVEAKAALAALDAALMALVLPDTTQLAAVFGAEPHFMSVKAALIDALQTPGERDRVGADLDRLRWHATALIDDHRRAEGFSAYLRVLIEQSGLSLLKVSQLSGVNIVRLRGFCRDVQPRLDMREIVGRLEQTLGVARDALWSRVRSSTRIIAVDDDVYTEAIRQELKSARLPPEIFPLDWNALDADAKREVLDWLRTEIMQATPYRRLLRHARCEQLPHADLPGKMADDFAALSKFKTVAVPREKFPREKKVRAEGRMATTHGGHWRQTSGTHALNNIKRMVTVAKEISKAADDDAWLTEGGLGYLINPDFQRDVGEYIARQRCERLVAVDAFGQLGYPKPPDGLVYILDDANRLEIMLGYFNPTTGYFYHHPPALVAIPGLISQDWVDEARADWPGTVKSSLQELRNVIDYIKRCAMVVRDPWLPIDGILDLDRPLEPVLRAVDQFERDRPAVFGLPWATARHDQTHLILMMLMEAKLRRANYPKITWRRDNTGHLRWNFKGHWELHIPQTELKNEDSSALPKKRADLIIVLKDPALVRAIERWLGTVDPKTGKVDEFGASRRVLHGEDCGDALFPGDGQPAISDSAISSIVYKFTAEYLVKYPWSERGIEGVLPFGPHAVRDIVATHMIKTTGSIHRAAQALFDTVATLMKHYARFTSREISESTSDTIRDSVDRSWPTRDENDEGKDAVRDD